MGTCPSCCNQSATSRSACHDIMDFNRSRRRLELRSAFTQERAVTFPKKTFFPLAGNGWLLSRSVASASKHSARSCSATFVSSGLKLIERGGDDFRMNAQTNSLRLRQNLDIL